MESHYQASPPAARATMYEGDLAKLQGRWKQVNGPWRFAIAGNQLAISRAGDGRLYSLQALRLHTDSVPKQSLGTSSGMAAWGNHRARYRLAGAKLTVWLETPDGAQRWELARE